VSNPSPQNNQIPLDNSSTLDNAPLEIQADKQELAQALADVKSPTLVPFALQRLDRALKKFPDAYKTFGNLAEMARTQITMSVNQDPITGSSIRIVSDELRQQLTLPTDTPLEHLIVEQCINAFMLHYLVEIKYARFGLTSETNVWDTRLQSSQKRFLRAVEALARIRQLALPVMQINIGETQTNIANSTNSVPTHTDIIDQR
jgi:hypothetical protein